MFLSHPRGYLYRNLGLQCSHLKKNMLEKFEQLKKFTRALRKMTRVASVDLASREEVVDVVVVVAAEDGGVARDGACFLRPLAIRVAQVRLTVVCFCWWFR